MVITGYCLGSNLHGPSLRVLQQAPSWIRNPRHQGKYSGKRNFLDDFRVYSKWLCICHTTIYSQYVSFSWRIYIFSKIRTAKIGKEEKTSFLLISSKYHEMFFFFKHSYIPNKEILQKNDPPPRYRYLLFAGNFRWASCFSIWCITIKWKISRSFSV